MSFGRTAGFLAPLTSLVFASASLALQPAAEPEPCPGDPAGKTPVRSLGARAPQLLLDENFPDPFVARFDGLFHAYATGAQVERSQANVQHISSRDLVDWSGPAEALPPRIAAAVAAASDR